MAKGENEPRRRRGRRKSSAGEERKGETGTRGGAQGRPAADERAGATGGGAKTGGRSGRRRGRRSGRGGESRQRPAVRREINADLPNEVKFRMPEPPPKREYDVCPICNQPMRDIHSAIAFPPSDVPAHFECVIRSISEGEKLAENERVVYLGNGSFGVVQDQSGQGKSHYVVVRRIQFEERDRVVQWRRELSPGISRD